MRMLANCSLIAFSAAGLLLAQHGGGGHSGGGGHASGGFHASAPAARSSSGYSGFTPARVVSPPPIGLQSYPSGFTGINRGAYSNQIHYGWPPTTTANRPVYGGGGRGGVYPVRRPGRYGYYGVGLYPAYGLGYWGNDFYDPYYDSQSYAPYAPADQYGPYAAMQDPNVETGPGSYYPPIPYAGPEQDQMQQQPAPAPDPPSLPIILILKSGQKLEVQNYAIVDGMFWDFSKPNSKRIPLANIDLAASEKATEASGGSFPEDSFGANPK